MKQFGGSCRSSIGIITRGDSRAVRRAPVEGVSAGVYHVEARTGHGVHVRKLIVE